jgi:hypothetical protein
MYKCTYAPGCDPCVFDSRFARDGRGELIYRDGTINGKVVRKCRRVVRGESVAFVDFASRKRFEATDDKTKEQDKQDHAWLLKELTKIGADIPDNPTLSELGAAYDRFDPRMAIATGQFVKKMDRKIGLKADVKSGNVLNGVEEDELTNAQLKAILDERGVSYPSIVNKAQLKELIAKSE